MLKVTFITETKFNGFYYEAGAVVELTTAEAEFIVGLGRATIADEVPKKTKSAKKKSDETA